MKTRLIYLHEWQIVRDGKQNQLDRSHILTVIHLKSQPYIPFQPQFS